METVKLVTLNVRGTLFQLDQEEWTKFLKWTTVHLRKIVSPATTPNCKRHLPAENSCSVYFLDRNPWFFNFILDYFHSEHLHFPHDACEQAVIDELEFYGISEDALSTCCWERIRQFKERAVLDEYIAKCWRGLGHRPTEVYIEEDEISPKEAEINYEKKPLRQGPTLCGVRISDACQIKIENVRKFLDDPNSSIYAKVWSGFISLIILLSVVVVISETEQSLREPSLASFSLTTNITHGNGLYLQYFLHSNGDKWLHVVDLILLVILTMEYIARLVVSQSKRRFILHPLSIIDVLGILPVWIFFAMGVVQTEIEEGKLSGNPNAALWDGAVQRAIMGLGVLRMLRVFRILRIFINVKSLKIVLLSVRRSGREMGILCTLLLVVACVFGSTIFYMELQVDNFPSIYVAMWWAIVTCTTVGYGDYYPETRGGYAIGVLCALTGIVVIALATTVIVSNFVHTYEAVERHLLRQYRKECACDSNKKKSIKTKDRQIKYPKYQNNM